MKILNTEKEDYHVHSLNFSDGLATVNEIVVFAGKLGLKKIIITDHSDAALKAENILTITPRVVVERWKNVYNDVEVGFGVEADLLNEKGDMCDTIQGIRGDFLILSYHPDIFSGDKEKLSEAFINAIERHHEKINFIGHIYSCFEGRKIDIEKIVALANKYKIPFELNGRYITTGKQYTDMDVLKFVLSNANQIYVTSDAHVLAEFEVDRKAGFDFLKEEGYI